VELRPERGGAMRLSVLFRAAKPRLALPGAAVAGSMCGLLAVTGDWRVFGTVLLIAGGVVLHRLYRYDLSALLFDGLIVLLPVMAIVGGGGFSLNIALSDAMLPFAILVCLAGKCGRRRGLAGDFGLPAVYGFCLFLAVTASLFKNLILSGTYAPAGVVNLVKLLVNIVYLLLFQTYFRQEKYRERLPAVWGGTAMVFSGLGIAGVVLYFLGRQTGLTLAYRLTGTVTDPNLAASYLLVSLGFALAANRQAGRPLLRPNTILPGVALLLTASRGGKRRPCRRLPSPSWYRRSAAGKQPSAEGDHRPYRHPDHICFGRREI
jgi:hypothetical protein